MKKPQKLSGLAQIRAKAKRRSLRKQAERRQLREGKRLEVEAMRKERRMALAKVSSRSLLKPSQHVRMPSLEPSTPDKYC